MNKFQGENLSEIISLKGVGQTYDGGSNWIIKDLNLSIVDKPDVGQFVVIMGMSGSGKSTILRYIAGLQSPSEGSISLNGQPIDSSNRVSMVFQQYSSLPWMTVLDNVALGLNFKGVEKKEREARALELISLVGLEGHEHKFAKYPNLSGGQLQRVAIARSLLANPSVLLMDEPFGALDVRTRLNMQDLLYSIWRKFHSTIVFVTHDISEAVYLGDEVLILGKNPSKIVERFDIDLDPDRGRETKRTKRYIELIHEIEDTMMRMANT